MTKQKKSFLCHHRIEILLVNDLLFFNIEHNWYLKPINSSMELNQHKVYCIFCSNSFWNWHHFSIDSFDSFDSSDAFVLNVLLLILCVNSGILLYFSFYYVFCHCLSALNSYYWMAHFCCSKNAVDCVDGHFAWIWLILNETNAICSCTQW